MTRNQRIKSVLDDKNISYDVLGEKLGVKKAAISGRLNRNKEIVDEVFINTVVELTGVSKEWILTGKGRYNYEGYVGIAEHDQSNLQDPDEEYRVKFYKLEGDKLRLESDLNTEKHLSKMKDEIIKSHWDTIAAKNALIDQLRSENNDLKSRLDEAMEELKKLKK